MNHITLNSPVGQISVFADEDAIVALEFGKATDGQGSPLVAEAATQLQAYFTGKLHQFDLPLAPAGTDFQRRVWNLMVEIPYGSSRSYGELSRILKSSPRAVGGACARNPIAIMIPCHRVLAAGGAIGGYSGGVGTNAKRILLNLEGHKELS